MRLAIGAAIAAIGMLHVISSRLRPSATTPILLVWDNWEPVQWATLVRLQERPNRMVHT
jgi:hypothetical protein